MIIMMPILILMMMTIMITSNVAGGEDDDDEEDWTSMGTHRIGTGNMHVSDAVWMSRELSKKGFKEADLFASFGTRELTNTERDMHRQLRHGG